MEQLLTLIKTPTTGVCPSSYHPKETPHLKYRLAAYIDFLFIFKFDSRIVQKLGYPVGIFFFYCYCQLVDIYIMNLFSCGHAGLLNSTKPWVRSSCHIILLITLWSSHFKIQTQKNFLEKLSCDTLNNNISDWSLNHFYLDE